jgi:hypothetical protein
VLTQYSAGKHVASLEHITDLNGSLDVYKYLEGLGLLCLAGNRQY